MHFGSQYNLGYDKDSTVKGDRSMYMIFKEIYRVGNLCK